ncbi:MAG: hypothetical protein ACRDQA_20130 [Nocardioidaceae bacterium]
MSTHAVEAPDHQDSARYLDELEVLREEEDALGGAFNSILIDINQLITVVGTIVLALAADPRLLLLGLASLPTLGCTRWLVRWRASAHGSS